MFISPKKTKIYSLFFVTE